MRKTASTETGADSRGFCDPMQRRFQRVCLIRSALTFRVTIGVTYHLGGGDHRLIPIMPRKNQSVILMSVSKVQYTCRSVLQAVRPLLYNLLLHFVTYFRVIVTNRGQFFLNHLLIFYVSISLKLNKHIRVHLNG